MRAKANVGGVTVDSNSRISLFAAVLCESPQALSYSPYAASDHGYSKNGANRGWFFPIALAERVVSLVSREDASGVQASLNSPATRWPTMVQDEPYTPGAQYVT